MTLTAQLTKQKSLGNISATHISINIRLNQYTFQSMFISMKLAFKLLLEVCSSPNLRIRKFPQNSKVSSWHMMLFSWQMVMTSLHMAGGPQV